MTTVWTEWKTQIGSNEPSNEFNTGKLRKSHRYLNGVAQGVLTYRNKRRSSLSLYEQTKIDYATHATTFFYTKDPSIWRRSRLSTCRSLIGQGTSWQPVTARYEPRAENYQRWCEPFTASVTVTPPTGPRLQACTAWTTHRIIILITRSSSRYCWSQPDG